MAYFRHNKLSPPQIAAGVLLVTAVGVASMILLVHRPAPTTGSQTDAAGLPTTSITAAYINAQPDAHLVYPGAIVLRTNVHPEGPTVFSIDGSSSDNAYVEVFMATPDSPTAVRDWYRTELDSRHYACTGGVGVDYMYAYDVYMRGSREIVVLGYIKPEQLRITFGQSVPFDRTIFETDYILGGPTNTVPSPIAPALCYHPLPPGPTP